LRLTLSGLLQRESAALGRRHFATAHFFPDTDSQALHHSLATRAALTAAMQVNHQRDFEKRQQREQHCIGGIHDTDINER
jgi:hypothetical protein